MIGVSVLSRQPLKADDLVSTWMIQRDYHTCRVAAAPPSVDGKEIAVASVHLSGGTKALN